MKADWNLVELGSLAEPSPNSMVDGPFGSDLKTSDYIDSGVPLIRIQNVRPDGFLNKGTRFISEAKAASLSRHAFRPGDIVIAKLGNQPGVACIVPESAGSGVIVADIVRMRPDFRRVDPRYICHFLNSPSAQQGLEMVTKGTTRQRINLGSFKNLLLPLPPLSEQRRIASILDQAEALRTKRRAALAKLDALAQSIFLEMFGDPVTNPMQWTTTRVDSMCDIVRGSSPRPQGDPRFFGGPVPRLMVADITRDGWLVTPMIDSLTVEGAKRSRPVPAGTVVMAVSGNVGLVSRLAIDACVHDGFVAFTHLDEAKCHPGYLLAVLHFSKSLHDKAKAGAIFINLTTTDIKAMALPIPPYHLQVEFLRRMEGEERIRMSVGSSARKLDALFGTLQHRAFRGEL